MSPTKKKAPTLTADQRLLVDAAILQVLQEYPQAIRFRQLDGYVRAKIAGPLGGTWTCRYTDAGCQRLRRSGAIVTTHQKWRLAPREVAS